MSPTSLIYRCTTAVSRRFAHTHILPLSILLGALLFGAAPTAAADPDDGNDREALVALYNATNGPNWNNNTNWLSDRPLGEWHGVSTDASGRVTRILLEFNQLSGALPSEVGILTSLTDLDLAYNDIRDISGLAGLTNLTVLDLTEIKGSQTSGAEQRSPLDLSPLAGLTSLIQLNLNYNKISDLSPLASLTNLKSLNLGAVHIRWDESDTSTLDLSPLADLTDLTDLDLPYNNVTDISPLASLINLTRLDIRSNHISDISPLAGLTELAYLNAQENEIANVSPLSGLTALRELVLSNNLISDIWPLVENAGLGRGDVVDVRTNPLNAESTSTHIPALLARGVDVSFDDVIVFTEPQVFNDNVLVMPVTENLAAGNLPRKDYASRFYERFNDEFDFLIFVPNLASGQHDPGVNVASYYLSVKNDVLGIGESTYANNDKWGSADRLQGVIDFGSYSIHYDRGFSILADGPTLHELMHRWANSVVPSTDPGGVHWGFSSANGNMGGFDIADLMHHGGNRYSAGNFTLAGAVDNIKPYSPIELYLAGFLPPEDVPDLWVAEDGEWLIDEAGNPVLTEDRHRIFTASQVKTYTIEDIIAEHGARVPDVSQAQKDFRAAVILLVDENHPATRESLETLSADVSWFSHAGDDETHRYNFYEATGGRGTITMGGLSAFLKDSSSHTPSGSVASDRAALVALYNATDGTNWHNNTNWLSDEPLGNWYGVTTDVNGRVSRLQLAENQLSGELPPELGDLSNLTYLTIYNNNQLSGEIPPELGSLSNLTMLELGGGSQLSGEIPSELGSLSKLTRLKLDYNKLTGNIPPELGSLSDLRVLALGGNQLSGSIPSELGSLSNLTWLGLELNELSGEIPSEFGNLSNLTSLYLQGAGQLSGSIPSELGNLSNLRDLYLAGNRHLVACLPEEARVLRATVPLEWTDINLLADCTGMEVVLTTNEDPLIYNENVFVLPVAEDLTAGQLPLGDYAARFYEYFHDDFDFLIFASNLSLFNHNPWEPTWWKFEYYGTYHGVMNDVQGIGVGMYSRNREWGSEDALQGTIHLSYSGAFSIGPALHELMHQWGNFIVPTGFGSHWGFSSANGQLGGFDIANLVDHGDGRYSVGSNDHAPYGWRAHIKPYSPIELYLAGLIPPEEVPDLWVAEDVEWLDEYTDDGDQIFTASKVRTYTIEDIIAEHGERVPDSSQSQKDFRAAAILLIDEDHPAVKWQLDKVSGHVSSFSLAGADEFDDTYNFYEATGGRATITMGGLSAFLKDSSSHTPSGSVALDRAALVALYHATDGPNWDTNTNWLSDEPLGDWHGVTTDTEGRVATLDLTENRLSGRMPNQLGDLSALGELRLGNNDLSGTIPPELGSLSALTRLDLENNDLSGAIPSQLGGMSDLRVLLLGDNNLSGHVPAQLGNLGELSYLRIRNNDLTGPIPPELGRLENLTHLYANKNDFVGSIPWELGSMSNLRYLFLNDNDLSGSIPAALGKLDELAYLWLNHNDLTGSIPAELGDLPNLVRLYINHNNLSGGIPRELGGLGKLELLYVHRNNLSGAIPRELGGLANLKRLYAYDNDLSGAIPMELASLANLERLHIAENDLSGELPQELGNLTNLVGLVLGDNDLDGEIPEELGRLAKLQTLYLHGNELSGEIPEELGELSALTDLWLNHNYLSGQITGDAEQPDSGQAVAP